MPRPWFEFGSCTPKRNPSDGPRRVSFRSLNLAERVKSPVSLVEFAPGASSERNCRHATRIDAEVILGHAFNLKLDVRSHSEIDADNADARQVASDARDGVLRALHEIDAGFDADRARWNDVDVFSDQRSLLRARDSSADNQKGQHEREALHC